jgi:hypothetical protein
MMMVDEVLAVLRRGGAGDEGDFQGTIMQAEFCALFRYPSFYGSFHEVS